MQTFPDHLPPPGYFETHSRDGVSWKSSQSARRKMDERGMAQLVRRFMEDVEDPEEGDEKTRTYPVGNIILRVTQAPWQPIPVVFLGDEHGDGQ